MKKQNYDKLPELVQSFITYFSVVKNKSPLTVNEYANDLTTFFRFLKISRGLVDASVEFGEIDISDVNQSLIESVTLDDAYKYLAYCQSERENNAATRSRKVSSLRAFYKYLTLQKRIFDDSPLRELDTPKTKKQLPKYLTLEQSLDVLGSVDGKYKERNYCILTLFLNCGLRLAELVGLNYTDVREDGTMRVTGKGNKERTIYLNDACREALKAYMAVRPVDGVKASDKQALFLSRHMQRISPKTVQYIVKSVFADCGLDNQGFSVHKLRHTAATLMYQYGHVDVLILKEILGHENLGTTEIYTHIVNEQLRKAADANPLSNVSPPRPPAIPTDNSEDKES
ncbi:MAG: tyrosine recombinase XerC [Clostridiales bacterium]|nr:tyrosine recombinase XerC [Clostridiales bacterium]